MKGKSRCKSIGGCVVAFGAGIITSCLLPWAAVSFAAAAVAIFAGLLLFIC